MRGRWLRIVVLLLLASGAASRDSRAQGVTTLGDVTAVSALQAGIEVHAGAAVMRVEALRDDVLRVRITPDGVFAEDASWAVLPAARTARLAVAADIGSKEPGFTTKALKVVIERSPMRLHVEDLAGHVLTEDAVGLPTEFRGRRDAQGGAFRLWQSLPGDAHIFGLGDKAGPLDRRGETFVDWNTDSFAFQESTDPLYKSIPFFLAESGGRYHGIFVDNTWRMAFDFGRTEAGAYSVSADGGPLDYYVLAGPAPKQVLEAYGWLTGLPPLPPLWSLGFQQSRFTYAPASKLREVADRLRADKLPADVLWLDIDFQDRDRTFTINKTAFPDMPKLLADLRAQHFHVVAITDLQIANVPREGYKPYDTGKAIDGFVKTAGGKDYVGKVWPGDSVFPDFTQAAVRTWWGLNYHAFVDDGFAGFWNDMNEPSVFSEATHTLPVDSLHRIATDGFAPRTATHAEIHNVYGTENARATYEAMQTLRPDERPFVMARAMYAGGQRYGVTWTGDNSSTWNHLRMSSTMLLNLGMSGVPFAGADVGGFVGSPTPDLLTKWLEVAAFQPIDRDHSDKRGRFQEPWSDGPEYEAIARKFLDTRYRLLPYFYTLAEEASRTGVPMMRPLLFEFPSAKPDGTPADLGGSEFMVGSALVVAPGVYPDKPDAYHPELPGTVWYDFWTGARMKRTRVTEADDLDWPAVTPALERLPVYVRGGSILPMQPLVQSTDETPAGPLEVHVYPGAGCAGSLYQDDGHTLAYQRGVFLREAFTCTEGKSVLRVTLGAREGSYAPWWQQLEVVVHGWPSAHFGVKTEDASAVVSSRYDTEAHALHVVVAAQAQAQTLQLTGW